MSPQNGIRNVRVAQQHIGAAIDPIDDASKSKEEKDERGHRHSIASTLLRYIIRTLDRHEAVESAWYGPLGGRSDDCVVTSPSVCFQILAPFTHCQSAAIRLFCDFRFEATTHSHDLTQWVLGFWKDYNA
jgi:hypothetical protein